MPTSDCGVINASTSRLLCSSQERALMSWCNHSLHTHRLCRLLTTITLVHWNGHHVKMPTSSLYSLTRNFRCFLHSQTIGNGGWAHDSWWHWMKMMDKIILEEWYRELEQNKRQKKTKKKHLMTENMQIKIQYYRVSWSCDLEHQSDWLSSKNNNNNNYGHIKCCDLIWQHLKCVQKP